MSALSRPGTEAVVAAVRQVGDVDVQRRLEEDRADGLQMRSCSPEPPAPSAELKREEIVFLKNICLPEDHHFNHHHDHLGIGPVAAVEGRYPRARGC